MPKYQLPFEVIGACRQSFKVRLNDGQEAYISNECLAELLRNPGAEYRVVSTSIRPGCRPWNWVEVAVFTRGFKPARRAMYDACGNRIG